MSQHISIGQFASLSGLSIRALRLYDDLGILKPIAVMKHNHYRFYASEQLELAKQIKDYRNLDLPLEQIRQIFQDPRTTQAILLAHLQFLRHGLHNYQTMIHELELILNHQM
jgi:DNA-binding transcriptional MerR regulator